MPEHTPLPDDTPGQELEEEPSTLQSSSSNMGRPSPSPRTSPAGESLDGVEEDLSLTSRGEALVPNSTDTTGDEPAPVRGTREDELSEEDLQIMRTVNRCGG